MKLFTRLQDDKSIIRNENGDIIKLIVQTYKEINVEGLTLEKKNTFNGEPCENYIEIKCSNEKVKVRSNKITNYTDTDDRYLEKHEGEFLENSLTSKKQFKYEDKPCKVVMENGDLYVVVSYDLIVYNVSKI